MKEQVELERVRREYEGKILAERENRMYRLDMMKEEMSERRKTLLASISEASKTVGAGISDFLENSERRNAAVLTISAVALGIYTAKVENGREPACRQKSFFLFPFVLRGRRKGS